MKLIALEVISTLLPKNNKNKKYRRGPGGGHPGGGGVRWACTGGDRVVGVREGSLAPWAAAAAARRLCIPYCVPLGLARSAYWNILCMVVMLATSHALRCSIEHTLHVCDTGNIPCTEVLVKCTCSIEHPMHDCDAGYIPCTEVLVER
eukprot:scaffold13490_cov69-Attheya_sp.AAC.4